jgi:hypothetical protein
MLKLITLIFVFSILASSSLNSYASLKAISVAIDQSSEAELNIPSLEEDFFSDSISGPEIAIVERDFSFPDQVQLMPQHQPLFLFRPPLELS